MEDCISFIKSNNFENNIKLFFDQIMALYNLVGRDQTMAINSISSFEDISSLEFILMNDSKEDSEYLYSLLETKVLNLYGHIYMVEPTLVENDIVLKLIEGASG